MTQLAKAFQNISDNKLCVGRDAVAICGTCGCGEAIKELEKINDIETELINMNINEIKALNLEGVLFGAFDPYISIIMVVFIRMRSKFNRNKVLSNWLNTIPDDNIRLFDAILFYVVRGYGIQIDLEDDWIAKCEELAKKTGDISLAESLYYANNHWAMENYPKLKDMV